ncbi:MAG: glycosyltransferase family 2 protein [Mycoplasmatales bacterium]|nr:glycosyltransferase family 2 protein [Mycoplasmatales bacterium]
MNKITVVVSMYNKEKFIEGCLDSLINQETKYSYDVIIVNDGSTDDSLKIATEKVKDLKNFNIITQENKRQGAARNKGIENTMTDFVVFVDADDIVYPYFVEEVLNAINKTKKDVIRYKFDYLDEKTNQIQKVKFPMNLYFRISYGVTYAINIKKNPSFRFVEKVRVEDMYTFFKFFKEKLPKSYLIKKSLFKYRVNILGGQDSTFINEEYLKDFKVALGFYKISKNKNILYKLDYWRKTHLYKKYSKELKKGKKYE